MRILEISCNSKHMYLHKYGMHFNKCLYEFAVEHMYKIDSNGSKKPIQTLSCEDLSNTLKKYNLSLKRGYTYDALYIMSMGIADFLGSSIPDEAHLAKFVKDYVDDDDQTEGFIFNRFCADCSLNEIEIPWDRFLCD